MKAENIPFFDKEKMQINANKWVLCTRFTCKKNFLGSMILISIMV